MSDMIKDIIVVILVALVFPVVFGMGIYCFAGDTFSSGFIIGLKVDAIIAVPIIMMFLIAIISA